MGWISDIFSIFDRAPVWKRLRTVPTEVDDLQKRVALLEEKLGSTWPPDVCKHCGERALRMAWALPNSTVGKIQQEWACLDCASTETRFV